MGATRASTGASRISASTLAIPPANEAPKASPSARGPCPDCVIG